MTSIQRGTLLIGKKIPERNMAGMITTWESIWKLSTERRRLPRATPKPREHERHQGDEPDQLDDDFEGELDPQEGSDHEHDHAVDERDGGAAGDLAETDGGAADGRHEDLAEEAELAVGHDGDAGEDGVHQDDHRDHAGEDELAVADTAGEGGDAVAQPLAEHDEHHDGHDEGGDHAGAVADVDQDLTQSR